MRRRRDASRYNGGNPNGQFAQVGKPAHATVLRNALAHESGEDAIHRVSTDGLFHACNPVSQKNWVFPVA
ncbi:hypothetical protein GNE08_26060 [Trichormus variabilis ARAD]|uniref:Transposase n=1 Tax=Trichormus variabilis N2B TaxID=2681315 RepID=A0ABR6S4C4_ANAVA|nr:MULTISPECIES: hypothetical protein [Nostocaceae]MBC1217664.1 hypothetical protein [Trichormus variabilis ARAD]MBC1254331.1 hypothetical protein [Trichormus variabilis V5]MBC1268047.1 hypothetical protein [Trichormus variabilis FSR]MBC1301249.1 hypothetical protein [Trichormus variabilis N2B]MBC1309763.1 hypothetical protein [Trichormus variabilis PNB]